MVHLYRVHRTLQAGEGAGFITANIRLTAHILHIFAFCVRNLVLYSRKSETSEEEKFFTVFH